MIDTGWFVGYLAIALTAICSRPAPAGQLRPEPSSSLTTLAIVAPFLPILGALGLIAVSDHLDGVTIAVAFVLVVLVLLRQALVIIDLLAPVRELESGLPDRFIEAIAATPPASTPRVSP